MGYKWISDPISVEVFTQGIGFQLVDIPGIEVPVPSGARGLPGYSPTVTVTTTTNGHQVEITDINGTTTFDVLDGTGGAAKTWTKISGSSTSSSETLTYPAEATELLIKAKCTYGGGTNAYICNVPVAAISDISIIQVGGYYFGAADYGLCNVNHSAANRTIAFRNIRYAGTGATTGIVTVYWR